MELEETLVCVIHRVNGMGQRELIYLFEPLIIMFKYTIDVIITIYLAHRLFLGFILILSICKRLIINKPATAERFLN